MDTVPPAPTSATKRALLVLSHAMERAFDTAPPAGERPGLVLALFQRRDHFDVEAARYAALAAAGHTVIVGFAGPHAGLPPGVHAVSLAEDDPRCLDWVLVAVRDAYVTALVATDARTLTPSELTWRPVAASRPAGPSAASSPWRRRPSSSTGWHPS